MTLGEKIIVTITTKVDGPDRSRILGEKAGLLVDLAGLERLAFDHSDVILAIRISEGKAWIRRVGWGR